MKANWILIIIASFFEVFWVIGLKHADGFWTWAATCISIIISFTFMIIAGRKISVGTAYASFVGMGTAGTVIADMLLFDQPFKLGKILFVLLLIIGVIGLKRVTKNHAPQGGDA